MKIDDQANDVRGKNAVISAADSKVKVMLIPTNEELAIAKRDQETGRGLILKNQFWKKLKYLLTEPAHRV